MTIAKQTPRQEMSCLQRLSTTTLVLSANHRRSILKDQDQEPPPSTSFGFLAQGDLEREGSTRGGQSKLLTIPRHMAVAFVDHYLPGGQDWLCKWQMNAGLLSSSPGAFEVEY